MPLLGKYKIKYGTKSLFIEHVKDTQNKATDEIDFY